MTNKHINKLKSDSIQSEEDFLRYKRLIDLDNEDAKYDTQKWIAIGISFSFIFYPILVLLMGYVNIDTRALVDIAPSYFLAGSGIISIFYGAEAYKSKNKNNN